jgi:hypothetical protein
MGGVRLPRPGFPGQLLLGISLRLGPSLTPSLTPSLAAPSAKSQVPSLGPSLALAVILSWTPVGLAQTTSAVLRSYALVVMSTREKKPPRNVS